MSTFYPCGHPPPSKRKKKYFNPPSFLPLHHIIISLGAAACHSLMLLPKHPYLQLFIAFSCWSGSSIWYIINTGPSSKLSSDILTLAAPIHWDSAALQQLIIGVDVGLANLKSWIWARVVAEMVSPGPLLSPPAPGLRVRASFPACMAKTRASSPTHICSGWDVCM